MTTKRLHRTGCHHSAKVMKADIKMRKRRPKESVMNRERITVKSLSVLKAYKVMPAVIPAVIPAAARTFSAG